MESQAIEQQHSAPGNDACNPKMKKFGQDSHKDVRPAPFARLEALSGSQRAQVTR